MKLCNCLKENRKYAIGLLAWIYGIGLVGLSLEYTRELFEITVPFAILAGVAFLAVYHEGYSPRFLVIMGIIYILGLLVEITGVATGLVFGEYSYGTTLGPKVWNTPLMIGVNWVLLIYCVWVMLNRFKWHLLVKSLVGSALMVFYDIFLEPVAIWLDMWKWELVKVPIQNYIAWFAISFVFFMLVGIFTPNIKNKIAPAVFIIQLSLFVLLNVVMILFV